MALSIARKRFILTAGHVIDALEGEYLFLGTDSVVIATGGRLTRIRAQTETSSRDPLDILALELLPEAAELFDPMSFLTLVGLDPLLVSTHVQPDSTFLLVGYPASVQSNWHPGSDISANAYSLFCTRGASGIFAHRGLDPTVNAFVGFRKQNVIDSRGARTAPDLWGMSGGGLWRVPPAPDTPPLLVGIATEWIKGRYNGVLVTRLPLLLGKLANTYPEVEHELTVWIEVVTRHLTTA